MQNSSLWGIRTKILLLVATAIAAAQIIICSVLLWQEARRYADAKRDTMVSAAQILAATSARAVAARDVSGMRDSLRAIGRIPGLVFAGIQDTHGRNLVDMGATERLDRDLKITATTKNIDLMALLRSRSVALSVPVILAGKTIGALQIITDTSDLPGRLYSAMALTLYGALGALLLALLLALRMQASITRPLTALTHAMSKISQQHDYAVTLETKSRDEIGMLVTGFNHMIGDIRERDTRLAQHREKLEEEVADRTRDFKQAKDSAEAANSAKSDFLATMSHEIRTPMNGILVMAELLAAGDLPDRSRRYAEVIARSGQSLVAIINDILDFSKIEAGKLDVEQIAVSPATCAETVVSLFAERAQSKKLDLAAHIDVDVPPTVLADPVRLNQVLGNLVNNALKFTESGNVCLRVSRNCKDPARIDFCVSDTGIGIAEDKLASVFGAFSQADQTTTRKFGGTGLGLSIARRLVAAMGGDIKVTSTLGEGSQFFFSLPAQESAESIAETQWPRLATSADAIVQMSGSATSDALVHYLQASGYRVRIESDASLVALTDAALIIAEQKTLNALDQRPGNAASHVIAIAAMGDPGLDTLLSRQIADTYLELPLSRADVATIVTAIRDGKKLTAKRQASSDTMQLANYSAMQVLVADDSPVNREVAGEALRRFQITPDMVEDGRQACQAVEQKTYDLVLMDGSMPELDGFEATLRIRARESETGRKRVPVIALTAHVVGAAANAWQDAGMDNVLHKPFTIASMADALRGVLGDGETQSETAMAESGGTSSFTGIVRQGDEDDSILDSALIAQLQEMAAAGRPDFVSRVIDLYREHAPAAMADITAGFESGDTEAIGKAAHALKSMSFNAGAKRVAVAAGELEQCARVEKSMPSPENIRTISELVDQACNELVKLAA